MVVDWIISGEGKLCQSFQRHYSVAGSNTICMSSSRDRLPHSVVSLSKLQDQCDVQHHYDDTDTVSFRTANHAGSVSRSLCCHRQHNGLQSLSRCAAGSHQCRPLDAIHHSVTSCYTTHPSRKHITNTGNCLWRGIKNLACRFSKRC